jgi:MarR family transcriptional regulator, temperature-dependent positive regulator of motility
MTAEDSATAIRAIRAWVRLDAAFAGFNRHLRAEFGVTGAQLALLRIVAEQDETTLAALRRRLVLHPATLGQLVDRLAVRGLVDVGQAPADRRSRRVAATDAGRRLLAAAPLAGPVRLRARPAEAARTAALAAALEDAVELFGLTTWATP